MTAIVISMLAIVVVAALVIVYVAFPHRGEQVPHVPLLGDLMSKAVDRLPVVDDEDDEVDDEVDMDGKGGPGDRAAR